MIELYTAKGMSPEDAQTIVNIFSRNKKAWVDVMLVEELGILPSAESPLKNALITFLLFWFFGLIPLLAYVAVRFMPVSRFHTFLLAGLFTTAALFVLGALKVKITGQNWIKSGLETLLIGGLRRRRIARWPGLDATELA